jgi:chlorobactene glucosyltransferase
MTQAQHIVLGIYGGTLLIWVLRHVALIFLLRSVDRLDLRSPRYRQSDAPLVSAIIPAKDEEDTLADCLSSVCAQDYPNLEILVVDDRSTDGTAAIARAFAARDPRVRMISITELPPGWTGKTHALHVAAAEASGAWLWFVDSDTRHTSSSLSIMMEYARSKGAELASLLPEMRCETFWERVVQPLAAVTLIQSFPLCFVNSDRFRLAFANGQYLLIRRDAYEAAGGHLAVRDRFVEDIYLAKAVKGTGRRIRVAVSREISSTRMYTSLPKIVRGWSRIEFDAAGRKPWSLLAKVIDPLLFSKPAQVAVVLGVLMWCLGMGGAFAPLLLGLGVIHHVLAASVLYRLYRLTVARPWEVVWYPLANLVVDWILLRAVGLCLTGRVTWRGTFYGPATAPARFDASVPVPLATTTEARQTA